MIKRITAILLSAVLLISLAPQMALAASISDYGQVNVMIQHRDKNSFLEVSQGGGNTSGLSARIWNYLTADGAVSGPAMCINHNSGYPMDYIPVTTTPYTTSPATNAAFSCGYPLVSLADFTAAHPETAGLTEAEYGYASQVAVWATLGQLAIPGTAYINGAETLVQPAEPEKLRVYQAVLAILNDAASGGSEFSVALRIQADESQFGDTVDTGSSESLSSAAESGIGGIRREMINGGEYFTREYTVASSSMPSAGRVVLSAADAPDGTVFTALDSWPLQNNYAYLTSNGTEYTARFKIAVPADAAATTTAGSITIQAAADVQTVVFYMADNTNPNQQNFLLAESSSSTANAVGYLKWGSADVPQPTPTPAPTSTPAPDVTPIPTPTPVIQTASLRVLKTGESGEALAGAEFDIDGSGGYHASGTTGSDGSITWTNLPADQAYTITETKAPDGYTIGDPVNVSVTASQTSYITVTDAVEKRVRIHKRDAQNGFSLEGAVFRFSQIDGDFVTEGRTGTDGILEYSSTGLPYGSYRVTEISAPEGYEKDSHVETIHWDGKADVDLIFKNARRMGFNILKVDADTNESLPGAWFEIYKDGTLITSVRTNDVGVATVSGLSEGYYEAVEITAPDGYVLDTARYGIHLDPYDPAASENPVLKISNRKNPALRIIKYDAATMKPLSNTTFEVYHNTVLLGTYVTDAKGEIYLYDLAPGTYRVQEIATDSSHIVNSSPQEIELKAGETESYQLVFLNQMKPGLHLVKLDSQTMLPLVNAKFRVSAIEGGFSQEYVTDANGEIDLSGLTPASYVVQEVQAPDGYLLDTAQREIKLEGDENMELVFTNSRKPGFKLIKIDNLTGERLPGATYRIAKIEDGTHYLDRITDVNGEINLSDLVPGVYSVQETKAPEGYVLNTTEFHVELFPGQTSQLVTGNDVKPDLRIVKRDAEDGAYLTGATFRVKKADGATITSGLTGTEGELVLESLDPGVYEVIEQSPPPGYLPARTSTQLITLTPNKLATVIFENYEKPSLTVNKVSSVSREPLKGAKFHITYRSDNTERGSMRDLGNFLTGDNGQFTLTDLTDGWYTITETESVTGYSIKEATQEIYIKGGEDRTLTFENIPLSALVVYKYDTVSGEAVTGAKFQVRKLTDTSGTGGTVIGTYVTGISGSFTVTGLSEGTYIVEEIASDSGHVIDSAPQTAYISGKQTDVVALYFGNAPKGSVLIRKIDAATHEPLSDVQFYITDSSGAVIGNAGGYYTTDSAGCILIEGLNPSATLVVKETRAKDGYVLDNVPQTAKVISGDTVSLEFRNAPYGGLLIQKRDTITKKPLAGAVFQITDSSGAFVDQYGNNISSPSGSSGTGANGFASSNGRYVTDDNGQINLSMLKPDTYVVTEVEAPDGYVLNAEPQTVHINSADTQTLTFGNPPKGTLLIVKQDSVTGAPMEGVSFSVKTSGGELLDDGTFVTDGSGQITISNLVPGTYVVTETATISGYVLDTSPHNVVVQSGATRTLKLTNKPKGNLIVRKIDSVTKEPLAGAEFKITTANGTLVDENEGLTSSMGLYVTDENGEIYLSKLNPGSYIVTETKAPENYKLVSNSKTVVVRAADTQTVTISDDPLCTLTLIKRDAVTQKGLAHAEFTVKYSDGKTIGTDNGRYVTGADGTVTVSGLTPDATVIVSEKRAPAGYVKDDSPKSIVVHTGVANSLTFDNEPTTTLVIRKYIDGTQYEPLAGVGFRVTDGSGAAVGPNDGTYYTDEAGEIVIGDLEPGITVTAREFKTVDGFVLNGNPQDIQIRREFLEKRDFLSRF